MVGFAGILRFNRNLNRSLRQAAKYANPHFAAAAEAWKTQTTPGVAAILESHGIPLDSVSSVVLSHTHWDHVGNLADLLNSASLLLGPGSLLGDDLIRELDVPPEVATARTIRELSRESDKWEDVGTFRGLDYFGDGSLWLLDVPGVR